MVDHLHLTLGLSASGIYLSSIHYDSLARKPSLTNRLSVSLCHTRSSASAGVFLCMLLRTLSLLLCIHLTELSSTEKTVQCDELLVGQYRCQQPKIDDRTQEPYGCERKCEKPSGEGQCIDTAPITCHAAPRIKCQGGTYNATLDVYVFERRTQCRWTNGKYYRTTLFLSLFLGMD